ETLLQLPAATVFRTVDPLRTWTEPEPRALATDLTAKLDGIVCTAHVPNVRDAPPSEVLL
ncbi:hypothetical protein, partial [Paraburkholderia sp. SIMBA_053]|uniref:hypothetical protein n=1 Tax=Paraburkholderia sp. SIMBA_053 TaxID=3085794 RepID=UPI003978899C